MNTPDWTAPDDDIAAFLDDYDTRGRDVAADQARSFAPNFLALDPQRASALTPAALEAVLPMRRRAFDEAGIGAFTRTGARQMRLDARHVLVAADWQAAHRPEPIPVSAIFLLRQEEHGYEIALYLNHTDLTAYLTTAGSPS
ncbi:hypothetical protein [Streptomyces sp. NPDC091219]|uniref:hypothetical protein n=1 Tax=Streptomyces sp. NPDC091219 TaxID=3155193 RepID=UPI00344DDF2D